ncbi:U4/U6 x U5 tri-snRNP complex Sm snRNP core protein Smg1 [Linderina pennispora]|nr:U4/U6 x U5 tri-snRNP complex Sm snRNP core protein Smg1 [Linderina pennispora]
MVLPQERIRWQCIKTKSAYTKALMAHLRQESSQSMVQAPLAPLYSLLDEYSARVPLSAAEKDLISVIPQLRSLVDRLAVADAGLRAAEDIWNELFMALNTPAKLATAYASPALAEFTTAIPIPSLVNSSEPRYLSHVGSSLRVIASKTRPKLLTLHLAGTTGEITKERYILKGNEDLRVDETVIQTFMRLNRVARSAEGGETEGASPLRHCAQLAVYNVVPTGLLGGLIQVVDNAPSLFFIYSQFAKAKFAPTSGLDGRNQPPTTMQIHRQCASRILKSNGVPPNTPSTKWPPELLAEVYDALVSTIPPNLLHRQVMGAALSPAHLHMASRNMVKTIAMSSMAGYILGLGDRHLDNLLVDVSRGQLVSIDFNVCFDFGGISRVPEQVPFRMTPILQYLCGSPTQSPGDASLGNWAFANSRTFARASGAALHFARMDKDALVNAIARRVQFQPFQEWGDIEMTWLKNSTRGQIHQQPSSANSPSTLDDSSSNRERWLSPDSGDASNQPSQTLPTSSLNLGSPQQAEEAIRATGLCPLSAFLPHGQTDVVCLTESSAGWRIAQAAVGRMAAKLEFRGSSVSDTCDSVVKEQVLTVWTASVAKENLMRMYAGWASWI